MARLHTHYENLKVSRDAPLEVIKAAYRVLAQRYHPDVNPSPDAARIMKVINEAWAVLSDPEARRRHDEWIEEQLIREALAEVDAEMRSASGRGQRSTPQPPAPSRASEPKPKQDLDAFNSWLANAGRGTYVLLGAAGLAFVVWVLSEGSKNAPSASAPIHQPEQLVIKGPQYTPSPPPTTTERLAPPTVRELTRTLDLRPAVPVGSAASANRCSPNDQPWPATAGYIKGKGIQQRAFGGLSKLTIDNSNGRSDVYVKLCRQGGNRCDALRHVFVPQGASFTMASLAPGAYDVRYCDLSSGSIAKSEAINLQQLEEERGTRFSVVRLTLYRVSGGNTSFAPITEDQF